MSARALAKLGLAPIPHIDLPVGPRPQLVNHAGFEVDEEEPIKDDANELVSRAVEAEEEDADVDMEAEEDAVAEEVEPSAEFEETEPLLSLADSSVLPFSLLQTRQRHLTHLFPHLFSHPPIPSHSRPRARPIPKGTFLFPTPAPSELPLPLKEYHAPAKPPPSALTAPPPPGSPAPGTPGTPDPAGQSRPSKPKAKGKERSIAPAHEIECIARVTLSIGPISYPGTEVWMGRFVNPRGNQPNGPRKREKGDAPVGAVPKKRKHDGGPPAAVKEKKKHLPAIAGMSVKTGPAPGTRPPQQPVAGPSRPPGMPPVPSTGAPAPRTPVPGRPPGASPTRPPIEPDLIQRVNQAATQHPWLSVIIHKAARNTASKEELAKLGRIVARLGKGEGVGEGPLDGLPSAPGSSSASVAGAATPRPPKTPASKADAKPATAATGSAKPPTSAAVPSGKASTSTSTMATTAAPKPSAGAAKAPADDDSSDDDFDMTGEPQTGGGPIDPELLPEVARPSMKTSSIPTPASVAGPSVPPSAKADEEARKVPAVPVTPANQVQPPAQVAADPRDAIPAWPPLGKSTLPATPAHQVRPPARVAADPRDSIPAWPPLGRSTLNAPSPAPGPSDSPAGSAAPPTPGPTATPHAPAPRQSRVYPLPPPFLLIAFKEMPTEKFLLPLGSQSYVSRIGSPAITKDPAAPEAATSTEAIKSDVTTGAERSTETTAVAAVETPLPASGRGRTRQSLGRSAMKPTVVRKEEPKSVDVPKLAELQQPLPSAPRQPVRSGLPPLSGISPPHGTVLLSTIIPVDDWLRPDWDKLAQRMPFYSKAYDEVVIPPSTETNASDTPAASASTADPINVHRSPKTRTRVPPSPRSHRRSDAALQKPSERDIDPNTLLNMGAESFMPPEGNVRAVTMRLEGVDDTAWTKMRWVMDHIDGVEMKALGAARPDLLEASVTAPASATPPAPISTSTGGTSSAPALTPAPVPDSAPIPTATPSAPRPPVPKPFDPTLHPRLRKAYDEYRRIRIQGLLARVASRTFPKYRLPARTDIRDALSDRWAPRKYPMSTRPLYLTSPPPEGEGDGELEEEEIVPQPKRKRGQAEEEVMFEMPVSLDMLDERVEAGAKKSVNRRVGKLKLGKHKEPKLTLSGRVKNVGKRSKPGMVCEGCARTDQKVWRKGPGGKGTLCNECGDKYSAGTLGDLLAPGAASAAREEDENDTEVKAEEVEAGAEEGQNAAASIAPTEPTEPSGGPVGSEEVARPTQGTVAQSEAATVDAAADAAPAAEPVSDPSGARDDEAGNAESGNGQPAEVDVSEPIVTATTSDE